MRFQKAPGKESKRKILGGVKSEQKKTYGKKTKISKGKKFLEWKRRLKVTSVLGKNLKRKNREFEGNMNIKPLRKTENRAH